MSVVFEQSVEQSVRAVRWAPGALVTASYQHHTVSFLLVSAPFISPRFLLCSLISVLSSLHEEFTFLLP
eukprot:m.345906 g.345906  ORF g.345906 m.345906 type:complete len:69 (+) comp55821_c0_seq8:2-208(+)